MVKYILFDIDDTLFPTTEFAELARKNAVRAMKTFGIDKTEKEVYRTLEEIISRKGSNYEAHFDELCKKLRITNNARFIAAAVAAYHNTKTAIQTYPEVPLVLLKLRERGYQLYAATNGNTLKQWDKLIRLQIALYFEDVFVSEELGVEKGDTFFKKVLKKLGATPEECVMIGDKETADIAPAKKLGMHTIRVKQGKYRKEPTSAEFQVDDLGEVPGIVENLSKHQ